MKHHSLVCACLGLLFTGPAVSAAEPLFERDILPLLQRNCLGCHGGLRQKGALDLRTIPSLLRGGESGAGAKAGDVNASLVWKRIAGDEMPEGEKKLSADEKKLIKDWIAAGLPTVAQRIKDDAPGLSAGQPHAAAEVAAAIDRHLERSLAATGLKPAARADDAEFLRRVTLDLTGRVPTAAAAAEFLDSADPEKRAKWIDSLLETAEFGEQLGRTWRDWIAPPELPSDPNSGRQPNNETQQLGKWFGGRFAKGEPWDKIVRDILSVNGETKNNPQVIFYGLSGEGGKSTPDGTARAVASLFMGVQLQCAQCHDDPYRDWDQTDHWALAAFFGKTGGDFQKIAESNQPDAKAAKVDLGKSPGQIVIPKSAFKNAGEAVQTAFLNGATFQPPSNGELRPPFVDWLTARDNPYLARAFANRLWFYFFARGIVMPVDDFRELNPPSHPGLMYLLGQEFAASGFDVKHLIRCLCQSAAYQRTSRVPKGTKEQTTAALTLAFGRMPLRLMTADQLYDSLKLGYGDPKLDLRAIDPKDGNTSGEGAPVLDPYLEMLRRFGTNEDDATDFTHGIPQMLTMINHPRLLSGSKSLDDHLQKTKPPPTADQTVEWLYLATLSRRPTAEEQADALAYFQNSVEPDKAWLGVLWTLVNRSEYLLVR